MTKPIKFFTIGYQSFADLRGLTVHLSEHSIDLVVDTRRYPYANTYASNPWCERNLRPGLAAANVDYEQLRSVAPSRQLLSDEKYGVAENSCSCRSVARCVQDNIHDRRTLSIDEFETRYLAEIRASGGTEQLRRLLIDNAHRHVVLLCAEANVNECHRKLLADALVERYSDEFTVTHF